MRVSNCEKCIRYQRKNWSHRHESAKYHAIGMTHAYGYCKLHDDRCLNIKKCEGKEEEND